MIFSERKRGLLVRRKVLLSKNKGRLIDKQKNEIGVATKG